MNIKPAAGLLLALLLAPAAHAVYKCKGPGGTTLYQDNPCETGGERITPQPNGPHIDQQARQKSLDAAANRRKPISELDPSTIKIDQQAVYNGMMGQKPVVGMNLTQLDWALGKPLRIDTEIKDGYIAQVHIYRGKDMAYDVYVREGIVVRILSRTR